MESITEIVKLLKSEKEKWDQEYYNIKINFKDVQSDLSHKASQWLNFQDGSGEIRIYEEDSPPYFDDFELGEVGKDLFLSGVSLLIPIAGPWIASGIIGLRSAKLVTTEFSWRNTYVFVFSSSLKKCVFAMEFHYPQSGSIAAILKSIENIVVDEEEEYERN